MSTIEESIPLAPFTTFHIGGVARYLTKAASLQDVIDALEFASKRNLPIFIFSGGSNILVADEGFPGLVILNKIKGIHETVEDGKTVITAGAGESWDDFVRYAVSRNLAGVETLAGIPGSVGAAPVQNIGAYGSEASRVIKEVIAYDLQKNKLVTLSNTECDFGYRRSIFNTSEIGRYLILEVAFTLESNGKAQLNYQDLKAYFESKPSPTLQEIYDAVLEIRSRKGMVIHPDYESFKSAGSFFKNPVVSQAEFEAVKAQLDEGDSKWFWPQSDGTVKISAAKLIEESGFKKGYKSGPVGISPKHSLSLINLDGARATDLIGLAKDIIFAVKSKFGISISPEVLMIGFAENPFK